MEQVTKTNYFNKGLVTSLFFNENAEIIEENAYCECKNLQYVYFSDNVKLVKKGAFKNCQNLRSIKYDGKTIFEEGAFEGCHNIKEVIYSSDVYKMFYLPTDNCYICSSFVRQEGNDKIYCGKIYAEDCLFIAPNSDVVNYIVVSDNQGQECFWFNTDLRLALIGAHWVASNKSFVDYFGFELEDSTELSWEQFSLLLGVCKTGRLMWDFYLHMLKLPRDSAVPLFLIKDCLQQTEPIIYERLEQIINKQHEPFTWLNVNELLSGSWFIEHFREKYCSHKENRKED